MELVLYILHAAYYGIRGIYMVWGEGVWCGAWGNLRPVGAYRGVNPLTVFVCPFIYTLACARTFHDGAINSTLPHRIGYMEHLNVLLNAAAHPGGYLWTRS